MRCVDGPQALPRRRAPGDARRRSVDVSPERPALGSRPKVNGVVGEYEWITYKELYRNAEAVGSALRSLGVEKGARVGIYSTNCSEWMMAMKAVDWCGGVCVPVYDTFGPEAVQFVITHSDMRVLFVESRNVATLKDVLPAVASQLAQVVVWSSVVGEDVDEATMQAVMDAGVPGTLWDKFVAFGESDIGSPSPGRLDDMCTIMYTSGTTGEPKGVEISHRAVLTAVGSLVLLLSQIEIPVGEKDIFLSYLPLAHIFDRVAEEAFLCIRGRIGYWQGSAKTLMDDVAALKPTIFAGVPRIFDRIYSGVTAKVNAQGGFAKWLFETAFSIKEFFVARGFTDVPVIDHLVFSKVKARLGGRVRVIVSGGAPLAKHVEHFLRITMCCPVAQGYGLTETLGASFVANPLDIKQASTVGMPLAGLDMRLDSVPDMGYDALASPRRGELVLRGSIVFMGYHKRPDLTEADKEASGWFHTGDIAELTEDGALRIIDRKKNFFKLSQGEYVAAEKLENVFKKVTAVDQIWVYGDSERAQLVGVVVPDTSALAQLVSEQGQDASSMSDADKAALLQKALEKEGRAAGLKGFEIVKKLHITDEPFSVENDLMTPSFKLKRPQLKKRFMPQIEAMYSELQ